MSGQAEPFQRIRNATRKTWQQAHNAGRRRKYGRKVCSQGETEQKGQEGAGSAETGHLGVQPGDEESREQKIVFPQTKNPGSGDILSRLNLCAHPGCHLGCHVADAEMFPVTCQNDRFFSGQEHFRSRVLQRFSGTFFLRHQRGRSNSQGLNTVYSARAKT